MRRLFRLAARLALIFLCVLSGCLMKFTVATRAQNAPAQSAQRRPLPKPPTGSRGFEQAGRDASSRLIAAGATRGGALKPTAPYEGLVYGTQPLFAWTPAPGATSYHFMLRDGTDSSAAVVYETDVRDAQLLYTPQAPPLVPDRLYSWRISTAGVFGRNLGASATFFVLSGEDAAEVRRALEKAKLSAPKNGADRLRQGHIFEQYGVWYDALRIASELTQENPNDADAKTFYGSLIQRLQDEDTKAASQSSGLALPLWREVKPLVAAANDAAARAVISRNPVGARTLYRELLFDAFASRLYENPPLQFSEEVRKLLAESDDENGALEAKFNEWTKERKPGVGFTNAGAGIEQILYLAEVANIRSAEKDPGKDAPQGSAPELTERALELSETNGIELAVASFSGNLSVYALREKRLEDLGPPLDRAEAIWTKWNHSTGLYQAPLLRRLRRIRFRKLERGGSFLRSRSRIGEGFARASRGKSQCALDASYSPTQRRRKRECACRVGPGCGRTAAGFEGDKQ